MKFILLSCFHATDAMPHSTAKAEDQDPIRHPNVQQTKTYLTPSLAWQRSNCPAVPVDGVDVEDRTVGSDLVLVRQTEHQHLKHVASRLTNTGRQQLECGHFLTSLNVRIYSWNTFYLIYLLWLRPGLRANNDETTSSFNLTSPNCVRWENVWKLPRSGVCEGIAGCWVNSVHRDFLNHWRELDKSYVWHCLQWLWWTVV